MLKKDISDKVLYFDQLLGNYDKALPKLIESYNSKLVHEEKTGEIKIV